MQLAQGLSHPRRGVNPLSPLASQLYLFANNENWTAGDPLPNIAPNGVSSLADNNGVQSETSSPIIGSKSGKYVSSDPDSHGGTKDSSLRTGSNLDLYTACWVRFVSLGKPIFLGNLDTVNGGGYGLQYRDGTPDFRFVYYDSGGFQSLNAGFGQASTGADYFVEGIFRSQNNQVEIRINDSVSSSGSTSSDIRQSKKGFYLGQIDGSNFLDGLLDQSIVEIANPGELVLPSESTWQYNGGAGRTASEYESKFNITLN